VWTLKFVQTVVIVPPVAVINSDPSTFVESFTFNQPLVESANTKVIEAFSVDIVASLLTPSILSDPFGDIVKLFV